MSFVKGLLFGVVGLAVGEGLAFVLLHQALLSEQAITIGFILFLIGWLMGVGVWDHWAREWFGMPVKPTPTFKSHGVKRYFMFSVDHKVIGVQYLITLVALFLVAGLMAMVIRYNLLNPAGNLADPVIYNTVMSFHGIVMVAVAVATLLGGIGNYIVPILIGAEDMAFPRLNALSYWFLPPVAILLVIGAFFPGGFQSGWRAYPPLSESTGFGMLLFILAFFTFGFSSILGGLNFIVTVAKMRAPGMSWGRLPIFVWSVFSASLLSMVFTQFIASALMMEVMDRTIGTAFFAAQGGSSVLYEHIFWAYSHPAVYVMILPGFGAMLEVLTHFARKPLFGYKATVGAFLGIVGLSGIVWVHHMFTSGIQSFIYAGFMVATELISIPTGLIFLAALGTLWQSRMRLTTPMLFALGFIFNFAIGGISGIWNADVSTDINLHNTYWVVGHFHYTIVGGEIFGLMAAIYYWFPKITGRMYNETLGKIHFTIMFLAFNLTFTPMMLAGFYGMNRHIASYPPQLAGINIWISSFAFVLGSSFLFFTYNMVNSWIRGPKASANPWQLRTLEWQTSSPPPEHNFDYEPQVLSSPYDYGVSNAPAHARVGPEPAAASSD